MKILSKICLAVSATGMAFLAGTVAYAAVPDANGVIHGCYAVDSGALRVIDASAQACVSGETRLDWSVQGPAGVPGGLSNAYTAAGSASLGPANYTKVAEVTLPAGRYVFSGRMTATNQQSGPTVVACNMYDNGGRFLDSSTATLPNSTLVGGVNSYITVPLHTSVTLPAPGRVRVECISTNVTGIWASAKLIATTVGNINPT